MALRPAKCYRRMKRASTRQSRKKPRKSYTKGVPGPKIHIYEMGTPRKSYSSSVFLVSNSNVLIRHNALESARVAANKVLVNALGKDEFFLKILIYPHHVMRENPLATGAGADRFSEGMRKSFGKPIGLAARVRSNQRIIEARVRPGKVDVGKRALKVAGAKLPTTTKIMVAPAG